MPVLHYQCPHCTGVFQVDPAMAGQQVACPTCQGVVAIGVIAPPEPALAAVSEVQQPAQVVSESPPAGGFLWPPDASSQGDRKDGQATSPVETLASAVPPPTSELLGCPHCGGAFQVTSAMTGQQMACPHCHGVVTIPGAPTSSAAMLDGAPPQPDALMAFRIQDSPKKIVVGDRVVEVRRLTPEEKAQRRLVKRIVLIGFCGMVLLGAMLYLYYVGLPQR